MTPAATQCLYVSPPALAAELGVSKHLVLRAVHSGALDAFRDGRVIRIKRTDADAWIAAHSTRRGLRVLGRDQDAADRGLLLLRHGRSCSDLQL